MEQAENRYVARLSIREVPLGGYKLMSRRQQRYEA